MTFTFVILGQIPSGKNSIVITRTGLRFPSKRFVEWRTRASAQLEKQIKELKKLTHLPISKAISVRISYTAQDKRRRDVPGMIDALWHLLEKLEVVSDDTFLGGEQCHVVFKNCGVNKEHAGVMIKLKLGNLCK